MNLISDIRTIRAENQEIAMNPEQGIGEWFAGVCRDHAKALMAGAPKSTNVIELRPVERSKFSPEYQSLLREQGAKAAEAAQVYEQALFAPTTMGAEELYLKAEMLRFEVMAIGVRMRKLLGEK